MSKRRSVGMRAAAVLATLATVGCQQPDFPQPANPHSAEEAANVYVAAYPAVPWSDISAKLVPTNNLTIDQARQLATVTTQSQVYQFLSEFAAGLGLGFALKSQTLTTNYAANGTQTTTGTRTETSGNVPASSGATSTPLTTGSAAPSLTGLPTPLGVDGSTILTAGTALYQQAQILDNQISNAILPKGYQAHLITLQVNLQPTQRNVSYDAYTDVTFFPGGAWAQMIAASDRVHGTAAGYPPVTVYPLVIMDALETTNVGRTIQAIQQAALSLSAVLGNTGVNAQASGGTARSNAFVGLDKNSLITVGRINDSTVRIRLGAENSGSVGLALVPRVYNISLVVLTRWDDGGGPQINSLQAITHTDFVAATGGRKLPTTFSGENLAESVRSLVWSYSTDSLTFSPAGCFPEAPAGKLPASDIRSDPPPPLSEQLKTAYLRFLRAADKGDYQQVANCLGQPAINAAQEVAVRRMLAQLVELQAGSRYSTLEIALREEPKLRLPDSYQLVLYADDGKQSTTAILRGGAGLDVRNLRAALAVAPKPSTAGKKAPAAAAKTALWLQASGITMVRDGAEVGLAFPSLSQAGLTLTPDQPLFVCVEDKTPCRPDDKPAPSNSARYAMQATQAAAAAIKNPVSASTTTLVADMNSTAQVTLHVGAMPDGVTGPLSLAVEGADVRAPAFSYKGIALAAAPVTVQLGNLAMGTPVKVTTVDKNGKPVGDPIVFTVLPPLITGK